MQYWQRRLQRSVTDNLKLRRGLLKVSATRLRSAVLDIRVGILHTLRRDGLALPERGHMGKTALSVNTLGVSDRLSDRY
jgi:hypothetical protein